MKKYYVLTAIDGNITVNVIEKESRYDAKNAAIYLSTQYLAKGIPAIIVSSLTKIAIETILCFKVKRPDIEAAQLRLKEILNAGKDEEEIMCQEAEKYCCMHA